MTDPTPQPGSPPPIQEVEPAVEGRCGFVPDGVHRCGKEPVAVEETQAASEEPA